MIRLLTTCILLCLSTVSFAHEGAEGVVKERMDRFKENKEAMKAIKGNLAGDTAVIAQKASEIEAWAKEMVNFSLRVPHSHRQRHSRLSGKSSIGLLTWPAPTKKPRPT